jgi:hypothetical protein
MLEPDQWDEVISRLQGVVYRGTERLASSVVLDALGVPPTQQDRRREGKPVSVAMNRWGWVGPKEMRVTAGTTCRGYWRLPNTPPRLVENLDVDLGRDDPFDADDLPHQLETLTRQSLKGVAAHFAAAA